MKYKKIGAVIAVLALIGTVSVSGILAYFTDKDTASNTFTVGKISLMLEEPNWDPEAAKNITPMQRILKDPQVKNDGQNPEFVFLEVKVPYENIITVNSDGSKNKAADVELYQYEINEGWTQLGTAQKDEGAKTVNYLYVYGTDSQCMELVKEAATPALFDSVTFANIIEDSSIEMAENQILLNAYGIQTSDINGGQTGPEEVWSVLKMQEGGTGL